ncbi:MAG: acyl-CoA--6-aminopenicillanic acid acyltransferase [Oscillospiraceae bacterium]|nr:acyl-CoA--6-aminopenicillanic acid acyltransferase [Oscillospiraceae bacterium]
MHHYEFHGGPYEMGRQLGVRMRSAGERITEQIPFPVTSERLAFARSCIPFYETWYPAALAELRGLSDAQGVSFDTLAGVLLPMYCLTPAPHCSCFAVRTEEGRSLLGRNSDFLTALADNNASCRFRRDSYTVWGNTTAFIELEDGVNNCGLAAGLTSVQPPAPPRPGLNAGLLLRLILETCCTTTEALTVLQDVPVASSHTFVLADRSGDIALAECCGTALAVRRRDYVCAVNAFHLPEMQPFVSPPEDGWRSEERYETLTRAHIKGVSDAIALLSGKKGFLCQYDPGFIGDTVWSVVYDLTGEKTYLSEGNPGRTAFHTTG